PDGFLARRVSGKILPFLKVEGAERAVVGVDDDLRLALKKQSERAAGGADVDRLPQPVQHKHMLVQRGVHGTDEMDAIRKDGAGQPRTAFTLLILLIVLVLGIFRKSGTRTTRRLKRNQRCQTVSCSAIFPA